MLHDLTLHVKRLSDTRAMRQSLRSSLLNVEQVWPSALPPANSPFTPHLHSPYARSPSPLTRPRTRRPGSCAGGHRHPSAAANCDPASSQTIPGMTSSNTLILNSPTSLPHSNCATSIRSSQLPCRSPPPTPRPCRPPHLRALPQRRRRDAGQIRARWSTKGWSGLNEWQRKRKPRLLRLQTSTHARVHTHTHTH